MLTFAERRERGKVGESRIAQFFKDKGYTVLPVYEVEMDTGKGPQLFTPSEELIAPDMLVFKMDKCFWIEAKHKSAFTWHRNTRRFTTGIDIKHYEDYCKVDDCTSWPVWLVFWHRGGQAKDSPPSPAGLFGNKLKYLRMNENHRSDKHGNSGMVYWSIDKLKRLDKT